METEVSKLMKQFLKVSDQEKKNREDRRARLVEMLIQSVSCEIGLCPRQMKLEGE